MRETSRDSEWQSALWNNSFLLLCLLFFFISSFIFPTCFETFDVSDGIISSCHHLLSFASQLLLSSCLLRSPFPDIHCPSQRSFTHISSFFFFPGLLSNLPWCFHLPCFYSELWFLSIFFIFLLKLCCKPLPSFLTHPFPSFHLLFTFPSSVFPFAILLFLLLSISSSCLLLQAYAERKWMRRDVYSLFFLPVYFLRREVHFN